MPPKRKRRSASAGKPKPSKAAKPGPESARDIYLTLLQQIPAAQREVLQQALGKGASLGMDDVFAALGVLRVAGAVWALLGPPAPFHKLKIFNPVLGLDLEDVELQHALGRGGLLAEAWKGLAPAKLRRCLAFVSVMYAFVNEAQLSLVLHGELGEATHGGRARAALLQGDLAQAAALLEEMNGTAGHNLTPAHLQLWSVVTVKYRGLQPGWCSAACWGWCRCSSRRSTGCGRRDALSSTKKITISIDTHALVADTDKV